MSTSVKEDKEFVKNYYEFFDDDIIFENLSPWLLRIELGDEYLLNKDITMNDIYEMLFIKYENLFLKV